MSDPAKRAEILASLEPLFAEADRTGKWLWCNYQDLWFSPAALRREQAKGSFIWGAVNWKLRDPKERVAEAQRAVTAAEAELRRVRKEVGE